MASPLGTKERRMWLAGILLSWLVCTIPVLSMHAYPLWWNVLTVDDPNGWWQDAFQIHRSLMAAFQITTGAFVLCGAAILAGMALFFAGWGILRAVRRARKNGAPLPFPQRTLLTAILIAGVMPISAYVLETPSHIRGADYPMFSEKAEAFSADVQEVIDNSQSYEAIHGEFPDSMEELLTEFPETPTRPHVARLEDFVICSSPFYDQDFLPVAIPNAVGFWDSFTPLVYCPAKDCLGEASRKQAMWYGDWVYGEIADCR